VTYSVPPHRCLRCGGTYVENDYRFDETGQGILIENEDLLYQACLKILLTDRGSNAYHPWYGTSIRSRIGTKALGGVASLISEDVRQALSKLQALQQSQATFQQVTYKERLYSVLSVQVLPHSQEQTTFLVDVTVQNASNEPIELSIVFTVPEVVALMGGNGLLLDGNRAGVTAGTSQNLFLTDGT
jgi:phage baseplate assembly protein W